MEFKINELISLKLNEKGETEVYMGGEKFLRCAFILLNISRESKLNEIEPNGINSIDKAAEYLDIYLEEGADPPPYEFQSLLEAITPEMKFWAHCSNLQVWAENGYDTRILHSNMSFPLLKRLAELGDKTALKIFKDEIMERFFSGVESVQGFLQEEGYLNYLSKEELYSMVYEDYSALLEIERACNSLVHVGPLGYMERPPYINVEKGKIVLAVLSHTGVTELPKSFQSLDQLTSLEILGAKLTYAPDFIGELRNLRTLNLSANEIEKLPESIGKLRKLEALELSGNKIAKLPESIGGLKNLRLLDLISNVLEELPISIGNLKNLEELRLHGNKILGLPKTIKSLRNVKKIYLSDNPFERLPEEVAELKNLEVLDLLRTKIKRLPNNLHTLPKLKRIDVRLTPIKDLPKELLKKEKRNKKKILWY